LSREEIGRIVGCTGKRGAAGPVSSVEEDVTLPYGTGIDIAAALPCSIADWVEYVNVRPEPATRADP
jgi:hypothetical protein